MHEVPADAITCHSREGRALASPSCSGQLRGAMHPPSGRVAAWARVGVQLGWKLAACSWSEDLASQFNKPREEYGLAYGDWQVA